MTLLAPQLPPSFRLHSGCPLLFEQLLNSVRRGCDSLLSMEGGRVEQRDGALVGGRAEAGVGLELTV